MTFRKSSYSDPKQSCVEVRNAPSTFGARDSKLAQSPVLTVTAEHGRAFLNAVQAGQFDQ